MPRFFLFLISCILVLALSCGGGKKASLPAEKKPVAPQALPVAEAADGNEPDEAAKTNNGTHDETRLFGQVSSLNKTLLGFQTLGTVQHMYAKPGMFFKKGQILAELDSRDHQLRAQAARLRRDQTLNQKKIAERDFNIEKELRDEQINTQVQFENATISSENAALTVAMAENDVKIAEKALSDTKLRAPYDCVVSRQIKFVGEPATGGLDGGAAYEIYDASTPELFLNAPESLLGRVHIGDEIQVRVPALKETVAAKVVRYVPVISDSTRTFLIVAHLSKPDKRIVSGYFIEGVLKISRKSGKTP